MFLFSVRLGAAFVFVCNLCFKIHLLTQASSRQDDEPVILVRTDQSGRAWPVTASAEPQEPRGGRRKRQMVSFTKVSAKE